MPCVHSRLLMVPQLPCGVTKVEGRRSDGTPAGKKTNPKQPRHPLNLREVMLFFLFLFISVFFFFFCFACHYVIVIAIARRQKCQASVVQHKAPRWRRSGRQPPHSLDLWFGFSFFSMFKQIWSGSEHTNVKHFHAGGRDWGPWRLMLGSFPSCPLHLYFSDFLIQATRQAGASQLTARGVKGGGLK